MSISNLHTPSSASAVHDIHANGDLSGSMSVQAEVRRLTALKDSIEQRIQAHVSVLQTNNADMSTPLVDREGFPRSDIDVAAVRTARYNIIMLRNDLKSCMAEMEQLVLKGLPRSSTSDETTTATNGHTSMDVDSVQTEPVAFARVDGVFPSSPADLAGLKREDMIVSIAHIHAQNHDRLRAVGQLVNSSEGTVLPLVITRQGQQLHLRLTPRSGWGGRGLLGCHIVPV
ncbi:putative 26S proteasome regulatory subunit [Microbotryomycetes sp. JL201]|nr:putative 26S proteasome regulatory subunit [Microbotryomycetes sp. JL201]